GHGHRPARVGGRHPPRRDAIGRPADLRIRPSPLERHADARAPAGRRRGVVRTAGAVLALLVFAPAVTAGAADQPAPSSPPPAPPQPPYLYDRGTGIATSQFGTYVRSKEWLVYVFYEYTRTSQFEYKPSELGFSGGEDFLGELREHEKLLYLAHGISDRMMI